MKKKLCSFFLACFIAILFLQFCKFEIKSDSREKEFIEFVDKYQEETFHEE